MTAGSGQVQLQQSLDNEPVQLLHKATNAKIAELAGTNQFQMFVMVNTKKEFPRGILDQVISNSSATAPAQRAPGPGLKLGEMDIASSKPQATSFKPQA